MRSPASLGVVLTALALRLVLGSNLAQLRHAHGSLETIVANQQTALANAQKAETQLDALAKGTRQLAESGSTNAARIVTVLQANGIRINDR